jgi:hypothetical protein
MEIKPQKTEINKTIYYLLRNLDILTRDEYWALHKRTQGKHSPAVASSYDKDALLRKAKNMNR